jgi:hypothetical protein
MRHRPIQAAPRERVPFTLWGPKRIRHALATATAAAIGLVPAVFVASPAQAAIADALTITSVGNWEGKGVVFKLSYTANASATFTITTSNGPAVPGVAGIAKGAATAANTPTVTDGVTTYEADFDNDTDADGGTTTLGTVTLSGGSVSTPVTALVTVDTVADGDTADENFTLIATSSGAGSDGSSKSGTGSIWALPTTVPKLTLSGPAAVKESDGNATVVANLSQPLGHDITLPINTDVTTKGGDADATPAGGVARDFTALAVDATISIPAGQTSGTVNVAINDDNIDEADTQYFLVKSAGITDPAGLLSGTPTLEIGIEDNDAAPTVSLGTPVAVNEGTEVSFPIKLSNLSERALTVAFATANGNDSDTGRGATGSANGAGADFTNTAGTVNIPKLTQTTYQAVTTTASDTTIEGTETFTASISQPSAGLTLGTPTTATATIKDTDSVPSVSFTDMDGDFDRDPGDVGVIDVFFDEGSTGSPAKEIEVKVTVSGTRETPLKIDYKFTDGTATNGVDYKGTAGSLTIPTTQGAGVWTGKIPVTIVGDTSYEGSAYNVANSDPDMRAEAFNVVLSSSNNTIASSSLITKAVYLIEGADDAQATWTTSDVSIVEGNEGQAMAKIPVSLSGPVGTDTVFTPVFTRTPGSATETGVNAGTTVGDNDYDLPTAKTLTIKAGETSGVIEVPINGDAVYERDEALVVDFDVAGTAIKTALTADVQHSARVTITGDDAKPTVKINEIAGAEGTTVRVAGTLSGVSQYGYTLGLTVAGTGDNPATAGKDFEVPSTLATTKIDITRGQTAFVDSKLAEFYLLPDDVDEATETFGVTVAETSAAPQGFTSATGNFRITDDPADLPPAASVQDESIGEWEQSVDVDVTFAFDENTKETSQTVTIPWQTSDGSAKQGEDYEFTKGVITLKPGDLTAKVNIPVINDKMKEGEENFYVKLLSASPTGAAIARGAGEVIIKSEDKADPVTPTLSVKGPARGVGLATFSGTAAPNTTVELWGAPLPQTNPASFKYLSETDADDEGYFELGSKSLASGWAFIARSQEINSAVKTVKVTQLPSFSASSPRKGKLSVSVAGNPRAAGQSVTVQRWSGGKWSTVGKGTTTATGWKGTFSYRSRTKLTLRAMVGGSASAGINSGYSSNRTVTIK